MVVNNIKWLEDYVILNAFTFYTLYNSRTDALSPLNKSRFK